MSTKILLKDPLNYSDALKYVLDIITINEKSNVVGSGKYAYAKYPGDVDVFETVDTDLSKVDAIELYSNLISTIAVEIMMSGKEILLNDFKAGADKRYKMDEKMTVYNRKKFSNSLCIDDLIDHQDHMELDKMNEKQFTEKLKTYSVLRWTLHELATGKKYLIKSKIITLSEAICMPDLVKMDVISYIEGRLQSLEVVYLFKFKGNPIQELGEYEERMRADFVKYSSQEHYNPLKLMKRVMAYSMYINCSEIVKLLTPLYSENMSALNQVIADVEILRDLVEKHKQPPIGIMLLEVLRFKKRLYNHLQPDVCEKIDRVKPIWLKWKKSGWFDAKTFLCVINELEENLKPIIFNLSKEYIDKITSKFNTIRCRPITL
uniref:Nucleotidyl transferase n=1 Tax=Pithovirus LCPAC403 TaxID=2506596 RepID=A0A481ZBH4_9VIRU|nr:MAG: nucleotidyl transferase [Pithovirus LCPAC403]